MTPPRTLSTPLPAKSWQTQPPNVSETGNEYHPRTVTLLCGWEGNRWSGVTPAMCHKFCCISTYRLNGLRKADEYPAFAPLAV